MFILDDIALAAAAESLFAYEAATAAAATAAADAAAAAAATEAAAATAGTTAAATGLESAATAGQAAQAAQATQAGLGGATQATDIAIHGTEPVAKGIAQAGAASPIPADATSTFTTPLADISALDPLTGLPPAPQMGAAPSAPTAGISQPPDYLAPQYASSTVPTAPTMPMAEAAQMPQLQEKTFFDKTLEFAKKNPGVAMTGGILGLQAIDAATRAKGGPPGYTPGILDKYRLSPEFRGSTVDPSRFQYTPTRYDYSPMGPQRYSNGGPIDVKDPVFPMSYIKSSDYSTGLNEPSPAIHMAKGGETGLAMMNMYQRMMSQQPRSDSAPGDTPSTPRSVGIVQDADPDTRNLDALRASQVRMAKLRKRAGLPSEKMPQYTSLGAMNVGLGKQQAAPEQEMAQGGMAGLGGYAAGGNPRLLKGPGDGMSDDIPATINGRQPARLADGEFVVPADVVSHLGNGSTDAGAKKLHDMMTKVRSARTGNPKQGKQIKAEKFIPR